MTLRDYRNWSDPPTADEVARAIVAASREVGAKPIDVAEGASGVGRAARVEARQAAGRARSYAAKALAAVFTSYPRSRIAGFVGNRGLVRQSYFSALDQRIRAGTVAWWNEAALARVVEAIRSGVMPPAAEAPLMSTVTARKVADSFRAPAVSRHAAQQPRPVAKPAPRREPDPEDDAEPVFDRGALGGVKRQQERPREMSKAEMAADLEQALRRTALMQKPED